MNNYLIIKAENRQLDNYKRLFQKYKVHAEIVKPKKCAKIDESLTEYGLADIRTFCQEED